MNKPELCEIREEFRIENLDGAHIGIAALEAKTTYTEATWRFHASVKILGPKTRGEGCIQGSCRYGDTFLVADWPFSYSLDGLGFSSWCIAWIRSYLPVEVTFPWLESDLSSIDAKDRERNSGRRRDHFWKRHLDLAHEGQRKGFFQVALNGDGAFEAPWAEFDFDASRAGFVAIPISEEK